jgi:hypothetical protein
MATQGPWWGESSIPETFAPRFLALGDPWFWYPRNNPALPLQRIVNRSWSQPIPVLGANGAEAEEFTGDTYRRQLARLLDPKKGYGRTIRAVFLSGGGNGVAGTDDLPALLKADCSSAVAAVDRFKRGEPRKSVVRVREFLMQVHEHVPAILPGTPVILHNYDHAEPNGKGFLALGQWRREPMDSVKVPRRLRRDVVQALIDALAKAQEKWIRPTFLPINTRATLSSNEWANELHPTPVGFNKLAAKWRKPLQDLGLV